MPIAALPSISLDFHRYGPDSSPHPPVVFVHGILVDLQLWDPVAGALGAAGHRCYTATWPLGAHRITWGNATAGPRGVAGLIAEFIADQGLQGCTLVGNDTGGAICQYLLADHPDLVGRVVLTNCDAFDTFPPQPFATLFRLLRHKALIKPLIGAMRLRAVRHSPLGFGLLLHDPDPNLTASWIRPLRFADRIRTDFAQLVAAMDPAELNRVTPTMRDFPGPVSIVWGADDRSFTLRLGARLAEAFGEDRPGGTRFVKVEGATTFVPLDRPDAVVEAVTAIAGVSR